MQFYFYFFISSLLGLLHILLCFTGLHFFCSCCDSSNRKYPLHIVIWRIEILVCFFWWYQISIIKDLSHMHSIMVALALIAVVSMEIHQELFSVSVGKSSSLLFTVFLWKHTVDKKGRRFTASHNSITELSYIYGKWDTVVNTSRWSHTS